MNYKEKKENRYFTCRADGLPPTKEYDPIVIWRAKKDEVCPKCGTKEFFIDNNNKGERRCRLCYENWSANK